MLFILLFKMHKGKDDYTNNLQYGAGDKNVFEIGQACKKTYGGINGEISRPNQKGQTNKLRNVVPPDEGKHAQGYKHDRQSKEERVFGIFRKRRYLLEYKEQNGRYKIYSESRHKRYKYGDRPSVLSAVLRLLRRSRLILLPEKIGHSYSERIGNPHYRENIGQTLPSFPL